MGGGDAGAERTDRTTEDIKVEVATGEAAKTSPSGQSYSGRRSHGGRGCYAAPAGPCAKKNGAEANGSVCRRASELRMSTCTLVHCMPMHCMPIQAD
jgi:hypothetical protein